MKKIVAVLATMLCVASLFAFEWPWQKKKNASKDLNAASGYTFGEEKTFHSDKPVTYPMFFSDASWYAMQDTWKTEGIFKDIEDLTNVHLDITSFDSGDYNQKINLAINSGSAAYIIPKVYEEGQYVAGGGVVPVSDYTQYMPNFTAFVNKYNLQSDLDSIRQADGKFYRLPGLHQAVAPNYTLMVRDDIFKAAGYDVRELEKTWTWESLLDVLIKVKEYMVKQGMCKASDYIWSDLWCGSESGKGSGGNLLKLMGTSYNVLSGWAIDGSNGGIKWDAKKKEFYSSSISEDFKKFVTVANKYVSSGILDPETFTQADDVANNKFFNGKTIIKSTNLSQMQSDIDSVKKIVPTAEIYVTVYPAGSTKNLSDGGRLENGVMLSTKALDELGEVEFIKMVRFVDWLFYSSEAYSLYKWGPEGKTWKWGTVDGVKAKVLLPGFKCGGLGIGGAESDTDIRLKWGYAGGNFWYGHSTAELTDNFDAARKDLYARFSAYKVTPAVDPAAKPSEDEREQLNLWATPLIDTINTWTLNFVLGNKDINKDWNAYVADCKNKNVEKVVKLVNDIYKKQK